MLNYYVKLFCFIIWNNTDRTVKTGYYLSQEIKDYNFKDDGRSFLDQLAKIAYQHIRTLKKLLHVKFMTS